MRLDLNFASREYLLLGKIYFGLGAGLAVCALVFMALAVMHRGDTGKVERLRGEVSAGEAELKAAEDALEVYSRTLDPKTVEATYVEADFANYAIKRRAFSWTTFLGRMEGIVPDGVGITGISPDFGSLYVDIAGTAKDMGALTSFIERLTGSVYFEDIPPAFSTSEEVLSKDIGKTVQKFNLKIRYIPEPAEAAPVPEAVEEDR